MPVSWVVAVAVQAAMAVEVTPYAVRRAEHERVRDPARWRTYLAAPDTQARRLAARAIGRLEDPALGTLLVGALRDPVPAVRREAAWGIGQAKVEHDLVAAYEAERHAAVRAALLEAMGRRTPPPAPPREGLVGAVRDAAERAFGETGRVRRTLLAGLVDSSTVVATGAAYGLLAQLGRTREADGEALPDGARQTVGAVLERTSDTTLRALLLRMLGAPGNRGASAYTIGRFTDDADDVVRWLAVSTMPFGFPRALGDRAPIVRLVAVGNNGGCDGARAALRDTSPHVAQFAVAVYGNASMRCDVARLDSLARAATPWPLRAEALSALATRDTARARPLIAVAARSRTWQERAWAARAAVAARDTATLRTLARDPEPNVALAALVTRDDAIAALGRDHAGLVLAAAAKLKGDPSLRTALPALLATLERLTRRPDALTWRDPRVAILERLSEVRDPALVARVRRWTSDADPAVAVAAARITGGDTVAIARRALPVPPFPDAGTLDALRGLGTIELELLTDDAPATVATIARLARARAYEGTTFHRIVPSFVLQGGSPGADEYDPRTPYFMRDEVGGRHRRGTWGISTRGRDTGDGQLFVNLVDNPRLDHDYTVFARTVAGTALLDRVTEGTVIERVVVVPRGGR